MYLVALKVPKWRFWLRFEHSWESTTEPTRTFQTVSEEKFCELRL